METGTWRTETRGETAADCQSSDRSCICGDIKTVIADKMHKVAVAVREKAADQDAQSAMAQFGTQASRVLDESADYIRKFDYEQADARVRAYVGQHPQRSLLIAGGVGLIIGAVFRRR